MVFATSKDPDQSAHMRSLTRVFVSRLDIILLLSRGSLECLLVKMPHCWKSHITAQLFLSILFQNFFQGIILSNLVNYTILTKQLSFMIHLRGTMVTASLES